ncbi:hypothetical protein LXL04_005231 [Taraxacum kok-saghyz]
MARVHLWYSSMFLVSMLVLSFHESFATQNERMVNHDVRYGPCDEIYVVREGETLHMIGEKCGDPYIVEENPHIHDPDDVGPTLARCKGGKKRYKKFEIEEKSKKRRY